jgi:CRISPR-associated protein Cas6
MPTIDLAFELVGTTIPLDHGYALFAALNRLMPDLHGNGRVGVHPIRGRQVDRGVLALVEGCKLRLRLPSEEVANYLAVAGSELELDGHRVRVGIPRVEALVPAPGLASRLVTYKNAQDPAALLEDVARDLAEMNVAGTAGLVPAQREGQDIQPIRRVLRVKGRRIVGFALRVNGLTAEESILLQERGLGGRRRMGCGIFVPMRA